MEALLGFNEGIMFWFLHRVVGTAIGRDAVGTEIEIYRGSG